MKTRQLEEAFGWSLCVRLLQVVQQILILHIQNAKKKKKK